MKPFKTRSKLILKNVVIKWYGESTLKILKNNYKVHKNRSPIRYFNYVFIGHKKSTNLIFGARSS
jgi:hypothetical protein